MMKYKTVTKAEVMVKAAKVDHTNSRGHDRVYRG